MSPGVLVTKALTQAQDAAQLLPSERTCDLAQPRDYSTSRRTANSVQNGQMTEADNTPTEDDVRDRSQLLPEEDEAGGSENPVAQARAILQESEERVNAPHDPPDGD